MAELEADMKKYKVSTSLDNLPHKSEYLKTGNDPDELLKIYIDWYDGSIRAMDSEIGRLFECLRDLGLEKDTLMVWVADHGEEFWEHGRLFHGHTVYGELNQVPLVFHWPNNPEIRKGVMIDQQIENIDIMPTILEACGVEMPAVVNGVKQSPLAGVSMIWFGEDGRVVRQLDYWNAAEDAALRPPGDWDPVAAHEGGAPPGP